MTKLEEIHYNQGLNDLEYLDVAANTTEKISIQFTIFLATNYVPILVNKELKHWQKGSYQNKEHCYTTQELFTEFIDNHYGK